MASFPSDFRVSCTPDLLQKFREKGAAYMLVFMVLFFFFSSFELCITMYLRQFALSRIPSHHDITCFLVHWLGNFFTTSLNQISSLHSLNTFQDSLNNNCQSIQIVFRSLKIKLSSASMIRRRRQIINSSLEDLLILSKLKSYKWQKSEKPLRIHHKHFRSMSVSKHLLTYPSPNCTYPSPNPTTVNWWQLMLD